MVLQRDVEGRAVLGNVVLDSLLHSHELPTPFYAYDVDAMVADALALRGGFGSRAHRICYAVKANSAGRILRRFADAGLGADVVSGGELQLCLEAGISPDAIVWNGVAKTDDDLDRALRAGETGILAIQVESGEEIARIEARARAAGRVAQVSIRVNPGVELATHAHIATGHDEAKFGVPTADLSSAFAACETSDAVRLIGFSMHIGSQMMETGEFTRAGTTLCRVATAWKTKGHPLSFLDFGGGYGVNYEGGESAKPADFASISCRLTHDHGLGEVMLQCEPGRRLVASHGVLVTRLVQVKRWNRPSSVGWLLLDAGMHTLIRPALYQARHRIEPLVKRNVPTATWRVAGPICESSDDFGSYELPADPPEMFVICDAGAYGYTMASLYNGWGLPTEVFIEGGRVTSVHNACGRDAWIASRLAT